MADENVDVEVIDAPVTSVDLEGIKSHKGEDGLNSFTDDHIKALDVWGSDDPTKAKFRTKDNKLDVVKLTKSYLELEKKAGKATAPLSEDATEAERFEYQKNVSRMLNVPPTPDEYNPIIPEGVTIDKDSMNEFLIGSHKHNASRELVQFALDAQIRLKAKEDKVLADALKKQNEDSDIKVRAHLGGADKFAASDELLQRHLKDFVESDEHYEAVVDGIKKTLFSGGEPVRTVIMKVLRHAAEQFKGEAKTIYSDAKERMSRREELKKQFPNSPEMWDEQLT